MHGFFQKAAKPALLACLLPLASCHPKRVAVTLRNDTHGDLKVTCFAAQSFMAADVWISVSQDGRELWKPVRIDSRDYLEDVPENYKEVEWSADCITLRPGFNRPVKVSLKDGSEIK